MYRLARGGFTLIEILVVISIIGLLASIILVSLKQARNKAADARIQQELNQIRNQLEIGNVDGVYTNLIPGPFPTQL